MERRTFLLATGGTLSIAGCLSDGGPEEIEGEGDVEIVDTELLEEPSRDGSTPVSWLRVDVENSGDGPHGQLEIESEFLADDGSVLDEGTHRTSYLPAETTLRYYLDGDFEMDEVDDVENEIVEANARIESSLLDVTVENTELNLGGDVLTVLGDLEGDVAGADPLLVVAAIYDESGRLRGTGTDIKFDPDPDERIEIDANSDGFRAPESSDEIESYDVLAFDGYT